MSKVSIICNGGKNTFIELVKSIEDSLKEIYEYKTYWLSLKDRTNIPYSDINIVIYGRYLKPPKNSFNILIQTEQNVISRAGFPLNEYNSVLNIFRGCDGIYLPLGYSKYFDCSYDCHEDIDFFFCGGKSNRRLEMIKKYNIFYKQKVFGEERNKLIQRSKWNVNIKDRDGWSYTPLRGIIIMSKGKILLQEEINDNKKYGYHEPYLIKFNEHNLLEIANQWRSKKKRKEFGMYIKESLMKNTFKEIFLDKLNQIGIK